MILKIRPPLKVIENAARVETIQYGPEAQWLVDRQDAIEEMGGTGDTLQYFQTSYQVLTSAFNIAMGDLSQGTSNFDPFSQQKKTATEITASSQQQHVRDEKNQNDLIEFIKDIMMMWVENNKQFLFADPSETEHVIRIIGTEQFARLKNLGLDDHELVPGADQMISDIVHQMGGDITDFQLQQMYEAAMIPKFPIVLNPKEKDPAKLQMKPKMTVNGDIADISVVPSDLEGTFDYVPDVKSMSLGATKELIGARNNAVALLTTNPAVLQLLQQEGYRPKIKEMLQSNFEDTGISDASRFFEKIDTAQGIPSQMGGAQSTGQVPGLSTAPPPNLGGSLQQLMAGPGAGGQGGQAPLPNGGGIPQGVF